MWSYFNRNQHPNILKKDWEKGKIEENQDQEISWENNCLKSTNI